MKSALLTVLLILPWFLQAQDCPYLYMSKPVEEKQLQWMKKGIRIINKSIKVSEDNEKTWDVYTLPIMKRQFVTLVVNQENNNEIVAYAALRDHEQYLSWIAVKESYRGNKNDPVAKNLIIYLLKSHDQLELDVRAKNTRGVKFYRGLQSVMQVQEVEGKKYQDDDLGIHFILGPLRLEGPI
jgi:ribosomal protein S18 acetylase RimI-like enzyme